jgi:SAM-dependent methyltransferase
MTRAGLAGAGPGAASDSAAGDGAAGDGAAGDGAAGDGAAGDAQALAMRLFLASLAAAELMTVYLGLRLGLYDTLATGSADAAALAARAGVGARYAREWLEQQAAAGIVTVDDPLAPADRRRYRLPEGHRQALVEGAGPVSVGPLAALPIGAIAPVLPRLMEAMRDGTGVPYRTYGEALRDAHAGMNRPVFERELPAWIRRALPDVHERLCRRGAGVADIGCGAGWSSIALAAAYPDADVHGFDLEPEAVGAAQANARDRGGPRLRFAVQDVTQAAGPRRYDLVCVFDALHDMPQPVEVLRACRALLADGGCVLLMEPRVGDRFTAPSGEVERFLYAVSVLHCLPVGLADSPSAGTGTVMRATMVRRYAIAAGFRAVTVLPVEHRFHRLYRLD